MTNTATVYNIYYKIEMATQITKCQKNSFQIN